MSICLHTCTQPRSPSTNSFDVLWYASPCVDDALLQVAGVADMVSCTMYTHSYISRQNSIIDRVSGSTGLFRGRRSGQIKSGVSYPSIHQPTHPSIIYLYTSLLSSKALSWVKTESHRLKGRFSQANGLATAADVGVFWGDNDRRPPSIYQQRQQVQFSLIWTREVR